MEPSLVFVLLTLAMLNAGASAHDNTTTLEDIYFEENRELMHEFPIRRFLSYSDVLEERMKQNDTDSGVNGTTMPMKEEIIDYVKTVTLNLLEDISSNLGRIPVQSIYNDLTNNCVDNLESPIVNLTVETNNVTCVSDRLRTMLTVAARSRLQNSSSVCSKQRLTLCRKVDANCTTAYEDKVANLLRNYILLKSAMVEGSYGPTPLKIIDKFLLFVVRMCFVPYSSAYVFIAERELPTATNSSAMTSEQLVWRNFKSDPDRMSFMCLNYVKIWWRLNIYPEMFYICNAVHMLQANFDFFSCIDTNQTFSSVTVPTITNHTGQ